MDTKQPKFIKGLARKVNAFLKMAIKHDGTAALTNGREYIVGKGNHVNMTVAFSEDYIIVGIKAKGECWAVLYDYTFNKGKLTLSYGGHIPGKSGLNFQELAALGAIS